MADVVAGGTAGSSGAGPGGLHEGLFENNHAVMLLIDPATGLIIDANPAAERFYGWKREELRSRSVFETTPYSREETDRLLAEVRENRRNYFDIQQCVADGTVRDVEIYSGTITLSGRPVLLSIISDVTARHRAEEELRRSERFLRAALDTTPDAVFIVDTQGVITDINPAYCSMSGRNREEIVGHRVEEFDCLQTAAVVEERIGELRSRGHVVFETFHRRADGTELHLEVAATFIDDGEGHIISFGRDLTERHARDRELRENDRYLRTILATTVDGFFIADRTGRIVDANEAFARLSGYTREELLGMGVNDLDADETPEETAERIARIMAGERTIFETRHRRRDGSLYHVENAVSLLDQEAGTIACFARDITERKRTEEELRTGRHKLAALLGNLPGMVYRCADAPGWPMVFVSEGCRTLTGYQPHELCGPDAIPFAELVHPDDWGMVTRKIRQAVSRAQPFVMEYRLRRRDGEERWVWEQGRSTPGEGGNPPGLEGLILDITARREAETLLQLERDRAQGYFDIAAVMLLVLDTGGRVSQINDKGCEVLCLARDEVLGSDWFDSFIPPGDRESLRAVFDRIMRGEDVELTEHENEVVAASGERRMIRWRNTVLRGTGGCPAGVLSSGEDITAQRQAEAERRHLEDQLAQSRRLESIGRLAGGIAHDFNNMLTVIIGNAEDALGELAPGSPLHPVLDDILSAANRSAKLTRQLLGFARRQPISPRLLDINATIESLCRMLARLIGEQVELVWRPGADAGLVRVDPAQVDQLLANLVVNARDAIHDVGRITIETGTRHVALDEALAHGDRKPGPYCLIRVSDTGKGMDAETVQHIFEPFYTTKNLAEGTGLGLATVYGIVGQNGGFIEVESQPGRGTRFEVFLPMQQADGPADSTPLPPTPRRRRVGTALLVEDEGPILALGLRMLEKIGCRAYGAATPAEAISIAQEHSGEITVLITDVIMPGMNGRDLAREVLAVHPGIKTIFISGYTADVIAEKGVLEEGVHFLQKPFTLAALAAKIDEALGRGD